MNAHTKAQHLHTHTLVFNTVLSTACTWVFPCPQKKILWTCPLSNSKPDPISWAPSISQLTTWTQHNSQTQLAKRWHKNQAIHSLSYKYFFWPAKSPPPLSLSLFLSTTFTLWHTPLPASWGPCACLAKNPDRMLPCQCQTYQNLTYRFKTKPKLIKPIRKRSKQPKTSSFHSM